MLTLRRRASTAHPGQGRAGCGVLDDGRETGTAAGASHPLAGDGRQGNVGPAVGLRSDAAEDCHRIDDPVTPVRHSRLLAVGARGRPVVQSTILMTGQAVASAGKNPLTTTPPNSPFREKRFPQLSGTASAPVTVWSNTGQMRSRGDLGKWPATLRLSCSNQQRQNRSRASSKQGQKPARGLRARGQVRTLAATSQGWGNTPGELIPKEL